ncbi:MAG TPA: radical SAM protein [Chloroflexota bacterium]|nr:radical SAM protein [Chloroflexota bacterium]
MSDYQHTYGHQRLHEPFLFLYITEKCQLRCQHCYMGERLDRERRMSPDHVQGLLRYLKTVHGQYKVYILGGEPTTHPDLPAILDVCREAGFQVVVTSNGLIPERVWPHLTTSRIQSLSFSMDGASTSTHEHMRGRGTYRRLIDSIERAVSAGFQTRAIFTVTTENQHEVEDAIELGERFGLDMMSFHYFTPTGLGKDKPHFQLPPAAWREVCSRLDTAAAMAGISVFYPPGFATSVELAVLTTDHSYPGCTARNLERLAIFPDGRVYICSMFFDTDEHYGIFNGTEIVPRIPEHDGARGGELRLVNSLSRNCIGCGMAAGCKGGCAAYDFFGTTLTSSGCTRELAPICPLWSRPAGTTRPPASLQDLR